MTTTPARRHVLVLVGGAPHPPPDDLAVPGDAVVIAADSGLALAGPLGVEVDLVVGDMDSVAPAQLAAAEAAGAVIERHPVAKDRTDMAIALDAAAGLAPAEVTVVGGHGGRLDHLLAGALLLADPAYADLRITARMATATVTVVRDEAVLRGRPGELVSLLPVHGPAVAVTTEGLRYPLVGEDLPAATTRGVSNQLLAARATVRLTSGVLLAVQPGVLGPALTPGGDPS